MNEKRNEEGGMQVLEFYGVGKLTSCFCLSNYRLQKSRKFYMNSCNQLNRYICNQCKATKNLERNQGLLQKNLSLFTSD